MDNFEVGVIYQRWVYYVNLYELLDTTFLYFTETLTVKKTNMFNFAINKSKDHVLWSSYIHIYIYIYITIGTSNQLFNRFFYWIKKYSRYLLNCVLCDSSILYSHHHSICLNIGFWEGSFVWICYAFNLSTFKYKTVL